MPQPKSLSLAPKRKKRKLGDLIALLKPSAHPFDPLLSGSRLQSMKLLLERAEKKTSTD